MTRSAIATIDVAAVRHNLTVVRRLSPQSKILAIIKANGYGHGIVRIARALANADGFGVAHVEEALTLRAAGVEQPIVVLQGFSDAQELLTMVEHRLEPVVHQFEHVEMLESARLERPLVVWQKINTGMHRLGFACEQTAAAWNRLRASPNVQDIRLMTHFANADVPADPSTLQQLHEFERVTRDLPGERSVANSAGVLLWPQSRLDWMRPGVMLYGISPVAGTSAETLGLKPAMTLTGRVIAVNAVRRGGRVGYGGDWIASVDTHVAVIGIGYGDGYPRHARSGTQVLVNGQIKPLAGRVSMDMLCVDLGSSPSARTGDPVVAWGAGLPVETIAECASTIAYELVCKVTQRVAIVEQGLGQG